MFNNLNIGNYCWLGKGYKLIPLQQSESARDANGLQ